MNRTHHFTDEFYSLSKKLYCFIPSLRNKNYSIIPRLRAAADILAIDSSICSNVCVAISE